ncbi:replication/maintenance protein RepL [Pontibacterium granulatum]|uniref:replication/maintenance protein RepL n=1 Tax=Pontibacterium granulatum TaxID=2036029 RepID=UPI00249B3630|nr:replication/maintenance protein RepL [Pontibacterium granulatum]MDI3323842.1 replication/maintenance protein RepL [Pontibacterium granulatum]
MKEIIEKEVVIQVDEEGQLIREEKKVVYKKSREDKFVKFYVTDLSGLAGVSATGLLYQLLSRMDYDGTVSLSVVDKRQISAELGVSLGVIDNQLQKLKKKDLIRSFDRGVFIVNPFYFARGSWSVIEKKREKWGKATVRNIKESVSEKVGGVDFVAEDDDFI